MAPSLTRAQQLALRRKLLAEAAKRRPARVVPPALLPRPTQYTRALVDLANELDAEIRAAIADEGLPVPRGDAADGEVPPFNRGDVLSRLQRIVDRVVRRRRGVLDKALLAVSAHVASVSKAQWARQARALLGIDLSQLEPDLRDSMRRFRAENLDLITSMSKDKVARVAKILDDAPNARVETIRNRIMEEHGVTKRQAALIARDQVLSLNAQVTRARHEAAGVTRYVWRTSGDADVRPAHKALDGKTFAYDDPPVVDPKKGRRENPGQDYQCRCTAEPIIEGFDDVAKTDRADAGDWKEGEHPRDKGGQFTSGGGGNRGPTQAKPTKPPTGPKAGTPMSPSTSGSASQKASPSPPPHPTTARAMGLRDDIVKQMGLHPVAGKKLAVGITEPDVPGAPRIVTVSNKAVYDAIKSGRIKLPPGEELGYPPEFDKNGKLLEESHVEVLGARWAVDKYGADGGTVGTTPPQCPKCKKKMAQNPRWVHTNPK